MISRQVEISQFLQSLADQLSVALCISRDKLDFTTLESLINSVGSERTLHSNSPILLIIGGVQQIVDPDESDTVIPSLPIIGAAHLPRRLPPGIRLILSGVVNTFTTNSDSSPAVLIPKNCSTLEIPPTTGQDAIDVCLHTLATENRMLNEEQITGVHQSLNHLENRSDLLNCCFTLARCFLTRIRSDELIDSGAIIRWIEDVGYSDFVRLYCTSFSTNVVLQVITCLQSASLTVGNEPPPGLTGNELENLLRFARQLTMEKGNPNCLDNSPIWDNTILPDSAECVILLEALYESPMIMLANGDTGKQYLDGFLRFVWHNSSALLGSEKLVQKTKAMSAIVVDAWSIVLSTQSLQTNGTVSVKDRKSDVLPDKETYRCSDASLGLEYNIRYLRHVGCALVQKRDLPEWAGRTWFSYSWLYSTIFSIGIRGLLDMFSENADSLPFINASDYSNSIRYQMVLVHEALTNSANLLQNHPSLLASELKGQLLPFVSCAPGSHFPKRGIDVLVEQCRTVAIWYNPIQPVHAYSGISGNPMIGRVACPSALIDMCIQSYSKTNVLLVKLDADPVIYRFACNSLKRLPDLEAGHGRMFSSPNGKYAMIIDPGQSDTIKVYQLDTSTWGRVPLIGQINTGLWIAASCGLTLTNLEVEILAVDLTDEHVGLIVRTKRLHYPTDSINNQTNSLGNQKTSLVEHLSAGTTNHVIIFELTTGKPVQILNPFPRSTFITLSQVGRMQNQEGDSKCSSIFFTNSDRVLLGFRTKTGEQLFALTMEQRPQKVLPSWIGGGQNVFVNFEHSAKIVQLKLNCNLEVSKSITISFENTLSGDQIIDFRLANSNSYILIHTHKQILVYDFHTDQLVAHIVPPAGMPHMIRLPNDAPRPLSFMAAEFGFHDRIVVTCIFRTILLWDIQLNRLLLNLYAPVGSLTRLLTDTTQRLLIGYSATSKELYLWDLTMALANITQTHNEALVYPVDRLTKPVNEVLCVNSAHNSTQVLARCVHSDELGVFDCETGRMTDLFTHEGQVISVTLSKCARYVLVGLELSEGYHSHPVNVIWSLESRQLVHEYGHSVGVHLSGGSSVATFLQLNLSSSGECDTLFEIYVTESENRADQPAIRIESKLTLAPLVKHVRPFWTADEQCLIALISEGFDHSRHVSLQPRLAMMFEQRSEWKIHYPNIRLQWEASETAPFILSAKGTRYDSYILIFFTMSTPDMCSDESIDWTSGVGLSKGLLLALVQTTPPELSVQKIILGLCNTSPHTSIYYAPTRSTIYDEQCGRFYVIPDCQAQLDLQYLETVELFDCLPASKSDHIACHGCIQMEYAWVLSLRQSIYLVNPILGELCGLIDTHHPISVILVSGNRLHVGCVDGYVLTYQITLNDESMNSDANAKSSYALSGVLAEAESNVSTINRESQDMGQMRRTRTWDSELGTIRDLDGPTNNTLDLTELEAVSAPLRNFRHQFTISKAKTCLLM